MKSNYDIFTSDWGVSDNCGMFLAGRMCCGVVMFCVTADTSFFYSFL